MTIITDHELLERIEAFLDRSGLSPTRFGLEAMSEGGLVASLHRGRSLSLKNVNKVLRFIAEQDAAAVHGAASSDRSAAPSCGNGEILAAAAGA